MLAVCALMLTVVAVLGPSGPHDATPTVMWASVAGLVVVAAAFTRLPPERLDRAGAFVLLGITGVTVLCLLAVGSGSTSTRTQAFLVFAVLYAGFHIRAAGALLVTAVAVAAGVVMLFASQPVTSAATDSLFFGSMLTVLGVLLTHAVGKQERLVAALQQQADVDALTGLVARRVFDEALEERRHAPGPDAGTALLLLDIDRFKMINDVHGHLAGDDALVHLSDVIRRQIRSVDALASRLGGDEVAVLLRDCSREVAARRAEELLDAVRRAPLRLPDGTHHVLSVSVGVSHVPDAVADLRELYSSADIALYTAKRGGRGRVEVALTGA
ncbi:GGDEF domain-containing protein [Blastococcus sp. KM273128]|nr:GGDEF domain-containing protein [Blastococcus sp. KM273128]